jgi:hypothetical protein
MQKYEKLEKIGEGNSYVWFSKEWKDYEGIDISRAH